MFESIIRYYLVFDGFKLYRNEIILNIYFCNWLFSFNIKVLRFIYMHSEIMHSFICCCTELYFILFTVEWDSNEFTTAVTPMMYVSTLLLINI